MSDYSQGPGWWQASDGKWYPPDSSTTAPPPTTGPFTAQTYAPSTYSQPVYGQQQQGRSGMAIGAMVCGIVGLAGGALTCGILAPAAIVAVVLGHIVLSQIKKDPSMQNSRGFAMTGVITGWIAIAIALLIGIAAIVIVATAESDGFCDRDEVFDPDCND